jgi:multiple sugar transport system ATP-binding protein
LYRQLPVLKMRVSTRADISKLHARLGATMIYVTHDQVEAMTMGDRICVMNDGRIMQVAEPLELYNEPANLFVAGFIGSPPMNLIRGTVEAGPSGPVFVERMTQGPALRIALDGALAKVAAGRVGRPTVFGIRPEDLQHDDGRSPANGVVNLPVKVEFAEPMGAETMLHVNTGAHGLIARVAPTRRYELGETLDLTARLSQAHLFDAETEERLITRS